MAEADLGKIVGMIMENPELVEKIKSLANDKDGESNDDATPIIPKDTEPVSSFPRQVSHRAELLHALGGFLSPERQKALESLTSVLGIIDTMKSK